MTNTNELKAFMVRCGKTNADIAKALGISRQSVSKKMNNHVEFTAKEVKIITIELGLTNEQRNMIFFGE